MWAHVVVVRHKGTEGDTITGDNTYRARGLNPWFPVYLKRESLSGPNYKAPTLGETSTGSSQAGLHLAHVHAILEADHLDVFVANVLHSIGQVDVDAGETATKARTNVVGSMVATTTTTTTAATDDTTTTSGTVVTLLLFLLFALDIVAPQIGATVDRGNVEHGDALQ